MQPSTSSPATSDSRLDWHDFTATKEWGAAFVRPRKYAKPHTFFVFDTEGDATVFRGCGIYWHDKEGACWQWVTQRETAIAWLRVLGLQGYVGYAHNLGYDLGTLFPQPWTELLTVNLAGEQITEARFDGHALYDSMGLCRMSVADIGESLGLPKLSYPPPDDGLESYCRRDCEIVYTLIGGMQTWAVGHKTRYSHRIGSLAVNYASGVADEPWPRARDLDQDCGDTAMYPGRAELYQRRPIDYVTIYDVNSMYPSILAGPLPDPRTGAWSETARPRPGFEDVTVSVPEQPMPPLPYHAPDGQVYYPTGTWRGTFATCELNAALAYDAAHIETFHGGYYYERTVRPFRSYVDTLYAERQAARACGNYAHALSCKLLLNALWGRLGLRPGLMRQVVRAEKWQPTECGRCHGCRTGSGCDRIRGADLHGAHWLRPLYAGGTPDYVNRAWAAWVAATARVKLRDLMLGAGTHLVRCHTDSITVAPYLLTSPIPPGNDIGEIKFEYQGPIEYRSPNAWRDSHSTHVAGISAEHAAEYWDTGKVTEQRAVSLLEGLAQGRVSTWRPVPLILDTAAIRPDRADGGRRAWTVEELTR